VNHDENPPTSIQSFFLYFFGCWANLPATMHRVLMILLPSILFPDRLFKIRLRRSADVFADDVVLESSKGSIAFDMDKVYQGELEGI
jgi:hypothetical protein